MPTIRSSSSNTSTDSAGRKVFEGVIDSDASVDAVWDVMADTQRLNESVFEMGAMEVVERGADLARMKTKIGPVAVEFDEMAWTFDAPTASRGGRYRSVRVFHGGPLKRLEAECDVDAKDGGARMTYRVKVTTAGLMGFAADAWVMGQVQKGFSRLGPLIEKAASPVDTALAFPPADHAKIAERARPYAAQTEALDPSSSGRVARLVSYVARAGDADVARLRPYELAKRMNEDKEAMLATLLRATKAGLVVMRWDVMCPSCALPVTAIKDLQAKHATMECPGCRISFETRINSNVEAAFSPLPAIREASSALFCLGSPKRTSHWISQLTLQPGESTTLTPTLSGGRYRVQGTALNTQTLVDVGATGSSKATVGLQVMPGRGAELPDATVPLKAGALELTLKNGDTKPHVVQLVHDAFADDAATAAHVIALPLYQELFG